jgi:hypothetical protein
LKIQLTPGEEPLGVKSAMRKLDPMQERRFHSSVLSPKKPVTADWLAS